MRYFKDVDEDSRLYPNDTENRRWGLIGFDADEASIRHWAECYGTTYETCMKWKSYWRTLYKNSK